MFLQVFKQESQGLHRCRCGWAKKEEEICYDVHNLACFQTILNSKRRESALVIVRARGRSLLAPPNDLSNVPRIQSPTNDKEKTRKRVIKRLRSETLYLFDVDFHVDFLFGRFRTDLSDRIQLTFLASSPSQVFSGVRPSQSVGRAEPQPRQRRFESR